MIRLAALGAWLLAAHAAVNAQLLRDPPAAAPAGRHAGTGPRVSVLVPARDEAHRIGPCIAALRASKGFAPDELEILVLDDRSADATAAVVRGVADGDARVRVVGGVEPPAGWLGKPHACAQLAGQARGEVLVFVDADVLVTADGLARAVRTLEAGPLDLVCPYPRQIVDGAATRVVQPLLQWSWLTFLPLRVAERAGRPSMVAANGQFLVCRADDYALAGGHAAVRDAVLEDVELGRAFVRAGLRAGVVAGHELASCAMYDGWYELREGYAKSLWAAFGGRAGSAGVMAVLFGLYVLPPLYLLRSLLRGDTTGARHGVVATAGGVCGRLVTARRTGGRPADAVWHPVSIAALGWLTWSSHRRHARGRLQWKGRPVPGRR